MKTKVIQKTLKTKADVVDIPFQREFSAAFRTTYERFGELKTEKDIRPILKDKWPDMNCWLAQNAILCARQEYNAHAAQRKTGQRTKNVVWGSRATRQQYLDKKITKDELKKARLRPVVSQGEVDKKSNRLFDFSKLNQNILVYKPNSDTKIEYKFITGKNQANEIQYLIDNIGKITIQVLLKAGQICFTYQQDKSKSTDKIPHRIIGIDMNPNYIGISIIDFRDNQEKLIKAKCFKISNAARKDDNKRNHETIQIGHEIIKLAKHYRCAEVAIELLTMGAKDNGLGKNFNRLCNNEWNRVEFHWIIKKLCDKNHIKLNEVNCAYSSTIGNILHRELPDPCAAAWEIARRGKFQYVKQLCMYPLVDFKKIDILDQWKKIGIDLTGSINWVDLHDGLKNSKLKYRVALGDIPSNVIDFYCKKSGVVIYSNFSTS
jgi:hypothetical protein